MRAKTGSGEQEEKEWRQIWKIGEIKDKMRKERGDLGEKKIRPIVEKRRNERKKKRQESKRGEQEESEE